MTNGYEKWTLSPYFPCEKKITRNCWLFRIIFRAMGNLYTFWISFDPLDHPKFLKENGKKFQDNWSLLKKYRNRLPYMYVLSCCTMKTSELSCFEPHYVRRHHCLKSGRIWSYSAPSFPAFGLNTEIYSVFLHIQWRCGKIRTRITRNADTFCTVAMCFTFLQPVKKYLGQVYKIE